jgi:hypothetical protein
VDQGLRENLSREREPTLEVAVSTKKRTSVRAEARGLHGRADVVAQKAGVLRQRSGHLFVVAYLDAERAPSFLASFSISRDHAPSSTSLGLPSK